MLNLFVYEEIKKIYHSHILLIMIMIFSVAFILPGLFLYLEGINEPIIFYSYNVFMSNLKIIYPLNSIILYSWIIGHEYNLKTWNILKVSSLNTEKLIISKFLACTIVISTLYIFFNLIYLCTLLFTTDINNIYSSGLNITFSEFISRWFTVLIETLLFIICIGSLTMLITFITKRWILTTITVIIVIILLPNIPFPNFLREHSPLSGFSIPQFFYFATLSINSIIKVCVNNLIYINMFLFLSILLEKKQGNKINRIN